jgi:acyl-CoA thioester hydrolase
MARPDSAFLDLRRYPFSSPVEPRFSDLDVNMHINGVAMAGFLEDGRVRFLRTSGYYDSIPGLATMAVSFSIEYLDQGYYPQPFVVHTALEATGRTSHGLIQLVMQDTRTIAFARTTMLATDKGRPVPLSPSFLDRADQWRLRP